MNNNQNYSKQIKKIMNSFTDSELRILLRVYYEISYYCEFFQSEETFEKFLLTCLDTPQKYEPEPFKKAMILFATEYTDSYRYPEVIETLKMIKNDYPFSSIITILYNKYTTSI